MSKRLFTPFVLVFAFACLLLPGQAFSELPPVGPVLTISKAHSGSFTVGTNGTYTITVSNGGADTTGSVTVTDTLPAGLTFIVGTGTGWTCSAAGQTVTCTNPGPIANGSPSTVTLTVSVGVAAVPSVTNTATVSGGGAGATGGSSNDDLTTVNKTVKSGPAVYISTFAGQQILAVDGAVGTTVAIHTETLASSFSPEDIVVGPDKRIYICDPGHSKIYRVRQDNTGFEIVYNQNSSPSLPAFPEGPSFNGTDLYFNTHFLQGTGTNGGVWKIANATGTVPAGPVGFTPTQVFDSNVEGEGTAFGTADATSGMLLFVERSSNQVLSCNPSSCTSPTTLIANGEGSPVLDDPIGIAVRNSDGHIFVANAGSTLKNINHFDSSGVFQETYASFSGTDHPFYLEFDALGRLYVVTNDLSGAGGKVWRIESPGGETNLVFLVALSASITGVAGTQAVGLGLAPNAFLTQHYAISGTPLKKQFAFSTTGDEVDITFPAILTAFDLTVFREEVPYALLGLQLPTSGPNLHFPCAEYDSDHGTCVVYEEGVGSALDPLPTGNFTGPVSYQLFYPPDPAHPISTPVLAHAEDDMLQAPVDQYDENELTGFTLVTSISSLIDPTGMNGGSGGISRHVALSAPLQGAFQSNAFFCGFNSPVPPGKTFLVGQTVPVKFTITTLANCAGSFVNNASMHLSVLKEGDGFQVVQSSNSRDKSDVFSVLHGQYIFNLSTIGYTAGTYIVTIWTKDGNGVAPQASFFRLQ